jgi:inosose dehydratase
MDVSFGINPITWSNDDLQYVGSNISLQTCLSEAAAAGYDGVELGHKFPREAEVLKPILDEHGLALVSGWYSGHLLEHDSQSEAVAMQAHAALLQQMACDVLIFAEVTGCVHSAQDLRLSQRPRLRPSQWQQFGRRMSELAKVAATRGLKLCYHHHMGTVVQSAGDIDALMHETTDDVFLLLDTGHAVFAGADPVSLTQQYGDRIGHVHCKDIRERILRSCLNRDSSFLEAVLDGAFTVPGDGSIPYEDVFSVLSGIDYKGWLVVEAEQDPSVAPPNHYARLGIRNLKTMISDG